MPAERVGMRDAREIIRLKFSGVSTHEIARRLGMARSTVRETLKRADVAGLAWPLPEDMTDGALETALYASRRNKRGAPGGIISLQGGGIIQESLGAIIPLQTGGFVGIGTSFTVTACLAILEQRRRTIGRLAAS